MNPTSRHLTSTLGTLYRPTRLKSILYGRISPQCNSSTQFIAIKHTMYAMATSSALLGTLLDAQHSRYHVLQYTHPINIPFHLETTWWTPLLFALAGIILGLSHPLLDNAFAVKPPQTLSSDDGGRWRQPRWGLDPGWFITLLGTTLFSIHYTYSAILEQPLLASYITVSLGQGLAMALPTLDMILAISAVAIWLGLDGSVQGLGMAALTAVCGPLLEIILINKLHLYTYSHPVVWGTPSWICWVYFAGGPAVGNLGRRVWHHVMLSEQGEKKEEEGEMD